ncbi:MAG: hypothetical protein K2H09_07785, partial [Treponemataceae bacterium]|nr:hypothetical protein [Treponemataceae bacterium]
MQADRKFLFLYLNTGAGHISAAKVLASAMKERQESVEIKMLNGFSKRKFGHVLFEKFYNYACNYIPGAFPLVYELGQHRWFQTGLKHFLAPETRRYLRKMVLRERPTDIVSFHFAITPYVRDVLQNIPWTVRFTVVVTDPFTVPHCWFWARDVRYLVYSPEAKAVAVKECGVPERNVEIIPFLMNQKFRDPVSPEEVLALRRKHNFAPDKKVVLLVGGGEGLPGALEIVNRCILHRANFAVAVVCGRDKVKRKNLTILGKMHRSLDLHVFGFVDFLDELVKICDCAVIKAGPATLMEMLSCRKPVIICKYIHNQELGNKRLAVGNNVGYFIRKPADIFRKINELLN